VDPFLVFARLGQYGTLLPLLGLTAFGAYAPQTPRPSPAVLRGLAVGGLAATAVYLLALSASMAGSLKDGATPGFIWLVVSSTSVGWALIVRAAALLIALLVIARGSSRLLIPASAVAAGTLAFGGHANSGEGLFRVLRLSSDMLHLGAAAVWVGALCAFLSLARRDAREPSTIRALEKFAGVGTAVVAVLIATGLINGITIVGWPLPPMNGAWLWLMLTKLTLFVGMLVLAAANRFKLTPKLASGPSVDAVRQLRASLMAETTLAASVLVLVAVLGTLMPPMVM
jgi:putative copper resistance protein D